MADEMHRFINFLHEILSISYVFSVLFLLLTVSMRNCIQSKPNYTRSNGFRHAEPARGHSIATYRWKYMQHSRSSLWTNEQ